jgi:hypothetical protein
MYGWDIHIVRMVLDQGLLVNVPTFMYDWGERETHERRSINAKPRRQRSWLMFNETVLNSMQSVQPLPCMFNCAECPGSISAENQVDIVCTETVIIVQYKDWG